jgi:hypothetical protein
MGKMFITVKEILGYGMSSELYLLKQQGGDNVTI